MINKNTGRSTRRAGQHLISYGGRVSSGRNREGLSTVAGVLADLFVVAEKFL
jgi:hypothetical protein